MLAALLFVCLLPALLSAKELPGNIKKCKNDPATFNKCVIDQSPAVIAALSKGIPKYHIPVIDPMKVLKIELTDTGNKQFGVNITLTDLNIQGLSNAKILKADFTDNAFKLVFNLPKYKLDTHYKMSGKALALPINGEGKATADMDNMTVTTIATYKLEKRDGKEYAIFNPEAKVTYTIDNAKFHLDNLYDGNKELGDATNKMINENWSEFNKAVGPGVAQAMGSVFGSVVAHIAESIPYDELFLK